MLFHVAGHGLSVVHMSSYVILLDQTKEMYRNKY